MFKHILLAVDGSGTSDLALSAAAELAREQQADLRIIHVVDAVMLDVFAPIDMYTPLNPPTPIAVEEYREAIRKSGQAILARAKAAAEKAGVQTETKLLEIETAGGRIAERVADEAKDWPADLIVIGTHGRRGLSHLFLGSVAESVIRIAPKPVLLVRGK